MMLAYALLLTQVEEKKDIDPKNLLRITMQQVQRAKTFEAVIEHHDSSGLFPGEFKQKLRWQKGVGFELVVTERIATESVIPNFFAREGTVTTLYRDMRRMTAPVDQGPNLTPSWEVLGGLNMSFLHQTGLATFLFAEPKKLPVDKNLPPDAQTLETPSLTYTLGERDKWQGERVKEIVATLTGKETRSFSIFIHPTSRYIIGVEAPDPTGKLGWMVYRSIKVDGEMPSDLGRVPGG